MVGTDGVRHEVWRGVDRTQCGGTLTLEAVASLKSEDGVVGQTYSEFLEQGQTPVVGSTQQRLLHTTPFLTMRVELTTQTTCTRAWEYVDAVQLVGYAERES